MATDYLAQVTKAHEQYTKANERLAAAAEKRRQAIGAAVANGVPIDTVAEILGHTYEHVRRTAAEVIGPRRYVRRPTSAKKAS